MRFRPLHWRWVFLLLAGASGGIRAWAAPATLATVLTNGPTANRFNIVVLSEGYTSNELSQLFLADATDAVSALLAHEPYQEYQGYFNAFAISVASAQSGSSHPVSGRTANTYFQSTYDQTDRIITIPAAGQAEVDALVQEFLPQCDLSVLLVNDPVSGGSDGFNKTAIVSTGPDVSDIFTHETGHVVGGLGDEYTNSYPGFPNIEEPNTTQETRRDYIKWRAWIDSSTPIPTPATYRYTDVIGLFEGAHYHATGWYRPKFDCLMHTINPDESFCEVCREAMVLAISRRVRLVDNFAPANTNLAVAPNQSVLLRLELLQPATHDLDVQWFEDGVALNGATNVVLNLQLPGPEGHVVSAVVQDNTAFVRTDPTNILRQTVTWTINGGFSNLVQTLEVSLIANIQGAVSSTGSTVVRARVVTRDIITALNQAPRGATFSTGAKLLFLSSLAGGSPRIVVRDPAQPNSIDTDVSNWFTKGILGAVTSSTTSSAGRTTGTRRAISQLAFASADLTLNLVGLARIALPSGVMTANVVGSGTVAQAPAVFQGTITLSRTTAQRLQR